MSRELERSRPRSATTLYGRTAAKGDPRERTIRTAYDLFSRYGVNLVGVDRIIDEAGVAKTTLYRHFASKDDLILEVLARREELWTVGWLRRDVERRARTPRSRLLVIFDLFGAWFARADYEGCLFTNVLVESHDSTSTIGAAAVAHLETVRAWLRGLADELGARDPDALSHRYQILMWGAMTSATAGERDAAPRARALAADLLDATTPRGGRRA